MTWIQFFMWMTIVYFVYYGLIILIDGARGGNQGDGFITDNHLTFSEEINPQIVDEDIEYDNGDGYNDDVEFAASPEEDNESIFSADNSITSTGGVLLKDLFRLARAEAIEFTRPVTF